MKSTKSYLVVAFIIALSVLLIIPLWAVYGVLLPGEGGHAHGAGEMVMAAEFEGKAMEFIEEHRLSDGSVEANHDEPLLIVVKQYTFTPNKIRLKAGEDYQLQFLSTDVVHAFSVQMGGSSHNATVMPGTITNLMVEVLQPGTYLVNCSEYCGLGHDFMFFTLIVEEGGEHEEGEHNEGDEHTEDEPHQGDTHG